MNYQNILIKNIKTWVMLKILKKIKLDFADNSSEFILFLKSI